MQLVPLRGVASQINLRMETAPPPTFTTWAGYGVVVGGGGGGGGGAGNVGNAGVDDQIRGGRHVGDELESFNGGGEGGGPGGVARVSARQREEDKSLPPPPPSPPLPPPPPSPDLPPGPIWDHLEERVTGEVGLYKLNPG
jgi:hypothetical protein